MEKRNGVENNKTGIKEAIEKSQYEKLANDWRQVHNIIWGIPAVAIAIMTGIILAAYQPQLTGPPRIVALSLGSILLFALTVELIKKRLLMNALSVRLQDLESPHTEKFPFSTKDLDALVTKKMKFNPDDKDPLYNLFKWDYARETLTYVTFIAAIAVAFLAEYEFVNEFVNEFVKYYENGPLGLAIGLVIGIGVVIAVLIYLIRKRRADEDRKKDEEDRKKKLDIDKVIVKGNLFSNLGKHAESIECFDKARKINLKNPDIFNKLGKGYQKSNNYKKAIEMYDEALILHDDADAFYNRACCKVKKGDVKKEEIKDDLIRAIMIDGDYERKAIEDNCFENIL